MSEKRTGRGGGEALAEHLFSTLFSVCVDVYISIMHSAQLMIDSRLHDTAFTAGSSVNRRKSSHRHPHIMLSCVFWVARALH